MGILGTFVKTAEGVWQYQTVEKDDLSQDMTLFQYCPLSPWYPSPFHDPKLSLDFKTVEQYFMLHKALMFGDQVTANKIMTKGSVQRIRMEDRPVNGFDEYVWSNKRYQVMLNGCLMKFSQNPYLNEFLQLTKDSLIAEANPKDKVWAIYLDQNDPRALVPEKWLGQNLLGRVLMEVRTKLAN